MKVLSLMWNMVIRPRVTARKIVATQDLAAAAQLVLGYGVVMAAGMLISHLAGEYPPPPADLATWIEAWGEFTMLPFINVPAEGYRLLQAAFMLPLMLVVWILMAGSARLLSILFRGRVSFDQYAALLPFSFLPFWILATIMDTILSGIFGDVVLRALRLEYGPAVKGLITGVYPVFYTVLFGLGAVYNAIVSREAERFSWWKAAIIGFVAFLWPIGAATLLLR